MIAKTFSYLAIGKFAKALGVSVPTVRRWCQVGKAFVAFRTLGSHRRFAQSELLRLQGCVEPLRKVGYARVSSSDQKHDLETQAQRLSGHCDVIIQDLGSGLNCKKRGLKQLLTALLQRQVSTLYLTHADRLVRFGHELIYLVCRWAGTDVVLLEAAEPIYFEEELCQDVLTLMTVFSARLYGRRSHKNRKST